MQSDSSIRTEIALYLNGLRVGFLQDEDSFIKVKPTGIALQMILPPNYDSRGIRISLGEDFGIAGFEISLLPTDNNTGVFSANPVDLESICGMRLIGKTSLSVHYFGRALMGYTTYVVFESNPTIMNYVGLMRNDLQSEEQAILDLYGLSREEFIFDPIEQEELCQPTLMKYAMLVHLYKGAKPLLALRPEELDCQLGVSSTGSWQLIHRVANISTGQIAQAYGKGERFFENSIASLPLPLRVPIQTKSTSFNVQSNRFIAGVLKDVLKEIEQIVSLLEDELEVIRAQVQGLRNSTSYKVYLEFKLTRLQRACDFCYQFKQDIHRFLQNMRDLGVALPKQLERRPVHLKMPYRVLVNAYHRYFSSTKIMQEVAFLLQPSCAVQTRSISYLYELWVTLHIFHILTQKLGFCRESSSTAIDKPLLTDLFSKNGIVLKKPGTKGFLRFCYNKKFSLLNQPFCLEQLGVFPRVMAGETRVIAKNNPDICLEFYDGMKEQPKILIFDPTFSNNPQVHKEKGYYRSLILYRESYNTPSKFWKKVVAESLAVHPYKPGDDLPLEGEWPLVPGTSIEESALFLEELLDMHGLL